MPRQVPPLPLTEAERTALVALRRARTTERGLAERAEVVLAAAGGESNAAIARRLLCSQPTVALWRRRFARAGAAGLQDAPRPGRPARYGAALRAEILAKTAAKPEGTTHWSTRRLGKELGVSAMTVQRVWKEERLKPHRTESFKFSRDPQLVPKVIDIVGLYLHPPEGAIVLCVDEKTQIQALSRTQPMLPLRPGQVERHTHDYRRNGTVDLYAALEVATGTVTGRTTARHRAKEFLDFCRVLVRRYPAGELHVVLDNSSTHKTPAVGRWLRRHKRVHFHFTPTSASWMNQIETWFGILSREAIARGSFEAVRALVAAIEGFIRKWADGATPFVWVKTADEILAKAVRKPKETSVTGH